MTYALPTQPPAGTALASNSVNNGLVIARNEAETNASTLLSGTATYTANAGGPAWATDSNGRYLQAGAPVNSIESFARWSGGSLACGPEYVIFAAYEHVAGAAPQALIDSDDGSTRNWQFRVDADNTVDFIPFNTAASPFPTKGPAALSTTAVSGIAVRVRLNSADSKYYASVWVNGAMGTEVAMTGTPASLAASGTISVGDHLGAGQPLAGKLYFWGIENRAPSDTEMASLSTNPYSGFNAAAGGTNGTATGATLTGTGSISGGTASGSAASGTLTTNVLKNNTGAVLANETSVTLNIYNPTTGALVLQATGLTTNASGIATVSNAALATGTSYAYEPVLSGGRRKLTVKAAS